MADILADFMKKILFLITVIASLIFMNSCDFLNFGSETPPDEDVENGASAVENVKIKYSEILPVKGGSRGIIVLVHDDGDIDSARILDSFYEEYGLSGDVAITAERFYGKENKTETDFWQELLDSGRWGMINHSMSHTFWGDSSTGVTDENKILREVVLSGDVLRETFPDEKILVFAYPGISAVSNVFGESIYEPLRDAVKDNYIAARWYSGGSAAFYNWSWNNMPTYGISLDSQRNLDMIDRAAENGEFISVLMHKVVYDYTINSNSSMQNDAYWSKRSVVEAMCRRIGEYVEDGILWSASYEDAVLYLKEAEVAMLSAIGEKNGVKVKIETGLDGKIYDYPLTVQLSVDQSWEAVKVVQGETVSYSETFLIGSSVYFNADIIPDGTEAVITPISLSDIPAEK